ncbi:MAG: nitroreductase family protein [Clostridia bacterium]|nr:nitroreductase family protein [Clostridia bacterium]
MEFFSAVDSRYSVRKYTDKKIENEKIERILKSGNIAPTAKNTNCVRIYAVTNEQMLEKMKEVSPCTFNAPLLLIVCSDEDVSWKNGSGESRGMMDASIAADHMMLSAVAEGLGTCWVCLFDREKMQKTLGMPQNVLPQCMIVCGYEAEDSVPNERHNIRVDRVTYVR